MKAEWHVVASFFIAIIFILLASHYQLIDLRSVQPLYLAGLIFLSGVFVDIDHLLSFWASKPDNPFSLKAFFEPKIYIERILGKMWVPLHSWELVILLFILLWLLGWPLWFLALWSGFFWHMVFDQIFNRALQPLAYFWFYRLLKKFKVLR